jgi:flagellin-like protein
MVEVVDGALGPELRYAIEKIITRLAEREWTLGPDPHGDHTMQAPSSWERARRGANRWTHRSRRRAVSPIIATILLVAITVVLASVLYVLVAGLTHGTVTPPIEESFLISTPLAGQCWTAGVTNHICGTKGDQLFNLTVQLATSVTFGDILLEVKTPANSVYKNTLAAGFAIMQAGVATPVAYYSIAASAGLAMTKSFTLGAGYSLSSRITTSMWVVVGTGTAATSWTPGQGNFVTVLGTGHFSGSTSGQVLP